MDEDTERADGDDEEWIEYEPVRGAFELNAVDMEQALLGAAEALGHVHRQRVFIGVVLLFLFAAAWWMALPWGVWTVTAAFLVGALWFAGFQHVWAGRTAFASAPSAAHRRSLTVDHEAIVRSSEGFERRLSWELLTGWTETEGAFLLLQHGLVVEVLAKRAFDETRLPELRELLDDCVPTSEASTQGTASTHSTALLWLALVVMLFAIYYLVRQ